MIKRINISLAGLLCLGGQYEHILCTSAAPTTNDTICQTEDDLDYISCNLEDLSDAALLEICSSHKLVSSEWSSKRFKYKDEYVASRQSLVVDAEICINVRDKIQLHLLTFDNIKLKHRHIVNTFVKTILYKKKDIYIPDKVIKLLKGIQI